MMARLLLRDCVLFPSWHWRYNAAAAILAYKGGLSSAVQGQEKKKKMAGNGCRGGKRLQMGVQYQAH
jgi:hypothetical protein